MRIWVDLEIIPLMHEGHTQEMAEKLGYRQPHERAQIETALKSVDEEKVRAVRLFATGKFFKAIRDSLWAECHDRRRTLR